MKILTAVLFSLVLPVCGQAADDAIVSTMGNGVGASTEEALKDSFRDAVERAVGVFVDAEAQAENDQLIRDQVLTHSNACIEKIQGGLGTQTPPALRAGSQDDSGPWAGHEPAGG